MSVWTALRAFFTAGKGVFGGLSESSAGPNPHALFEQWFREASKAGLFLPESMTLATATPDGKPSARLVLLKHHDERGFVFFTNYESRKALELEENPLSTLVSHWPVLQRQIRIEGSAEQISQEESEAYFRTRPRGSQIGAWASDQSRPLASRRELEERVGQIEERFRGQEIPLPPFWGGYRLRPQAMEFWQGRANRLHDRIRFEKDGESWSRVRLFP
jgi:pyridoxamine 5'-phosphate oxidase